MKIELSQKHLFWSAKLFKFDLICLALIFYPFAWLVEKFLSRKKRPLFWSGLAGKILKLVFYSSRIDLSFKEQKNIEPSLYLTEEDSLWNNLILLAQFGSKINFFIPNNKVFPLIIAKWLRKMGVLALFNNQKQSFLTPHEIIEATLSALKRGQSVIICPSELSLFEAVKDYFQSGAGRIILAQQTPIIPVVIKGAEKIFLTAQQLGQGIIEIELEAPLSTPRVFTGHVCYANLGVLIHS